MNNAKLKSGDPGCLHISCGQVYDLMADFSTQPQISKFHQNTSLYHQIFFLISNSR